MFTGLYAHPEAPTIPLTYPKSGRPSTVPISTCPSPTSGPIKPSKGRSLQPMDRNHQGHSVDFTPLQDESVPLDNEGSSLIVQRNRLVSGSWILQMRMEGP
ncbi:hypothetical protein NLI96_g6770 [Meripilus lineatus]|uniref:Uncharacterized protein n=1 Tax=Meripilus lineatus TaxID=2056292 RepID=A0AAD5YDJ9_9APHY|nr:hypothetical protein NLI96_g6770 [Physisporinus lineatus]